MKYAVILAAMTLVGSAAMAEAGERHSRLAQFGKGGTGIVIERDRPAEAPAYGLTGNTGATQDQYITKEVNSVKHSGQVRVPQADRE